jgi:hypothetical protein
MTNVSQTSVKNTTSSLEFARRVQDAITRSDSSGKPFSVVLLQLANMAAFRSQRPSHVCNGLLRELQSGMRKAVHPNQYVGILHDGLGLVFENVELGQVDVLGRRLVMVAQSIIKSGQYNDLSSRWSDIIYQFLWPNKPGIVFPCIGWSMYPRDGASGQELVKRALNHLSELRR